MSTKCGVLRITKRQFYLFGGFSNPSLFRRQVRGVWHYYDNFN